MMSIKHKWENKQVSLIQYLHNTTDQWFKAVLSIFIELTAKEKANPLLHSSPTTRNVASLEARG